MYYRTAGFASVSRAIFGAGWPLRGAVVLSPRDKDGGLFHRVAGQLRSCRLILRRRLGRLVNSSPMIMRLLASTAAATNKAKRSAPSARQRFMPRPRISTEMRPSIPARKRWPCLNAADRSWSRRCGVLLPPRYGIETVATPPCTHTVTLRSLKKPRSAP
jgi:hypothetical protein